MGGPLEPGPLRDAVGGVSMPGRLELFPGHPDVLLDGAHNPAGMEAMVASLPAELAGRRPVAVVSVLGDKDAGAMVGALRGVVAEVGRHPVEPRAGGAGGGPRRAGARGGGRGARGRRTPPPPSRPPATWRGPRGRCWWPDPCTCWLICGPGCRGRSGTPC